ncbi:LysR family transcriptional regulator (plasmid) [Klebsiella aerogenes]|uniref:LysR family transcriptional regulator n=1 Tax=Klebsiella aerogenes TaxID=548 RepID=UPI002A81CE67|nr:LysR family transcriptional regulator [Klebsiella aerogenes]WPS11063.1 LysR family transcriptional regulator [Klebsiella aerogenes]
MDKLTAMQTFVTVIDTGSFTRAAVQLGIPKARVSQRISDLEKHLGVLLIQRTTRNLKLSKDGGEYYLKCQSVLKEIDDMENVIKLRNSTPDGELHIDSLFSIARWVLAPHLHEFHSLYPDVRVKLGSSDNIRNMLEEGIDCSIRGGLLADSNYIARHVCDVSLGLYASPNYIASSEIVSSPEKLTGYKWISWFSSSRTPFNWTLESNGRNINLRGSGIYLFDDPDVAISSCIEGEGVCPATPFAVARYVSDGLLIPLLPDWSFPPRPVHIIYRNRNNLPLKTRLFIEWFLNLINRKKGLYLNPMELYQSISYIK